MSPLCVDRTLPDGGPFVDGGGVDCASYGKNDWCLFTVTDSPAKGWSRMLHVACARCWNLGTRSTFMPSSIRPDVQDMYLGRDAQRP